jgi:hypothetical protein
MDMRRSGAPQRCRARGAQGASMHIRAERYTTKASLAGLLLLASMRMSSRY